MTAAAVDHDLLGFPGVGVELSGWGQVLLGAVAALAVVFALVRIVRLLRRRRR